MFPLPWEHVWLRTRRYAVTDFRVVTLRRGRVTGEIALHDVASITVARHALTRVTSLGTLVVTSTQQHGISSPTSEPTATHEC